MILHPLLVCPKGIHGEDYNKEIRNDFSFDDSVKANKSCCMTSNRIYRALNEYVSVLLHDYESIWENSVNNSSDGYFRRYCLSNALQNWCRPAIIGREAEECSLIRDTQEQQKFRKKLEPLAIGSHLMRWPTYQTTLHVYFHYDFETGKSDTQLLKDVDSLSGMTLPQSIIHKPFDYADPIHPPVDSTLKLFQFNLVAISAESYKTCEWQRTFLKELLEEGKWGVIGQRHNFLIPFFLCPDSDLPDFVSEEMTRFSFVLNQHGQFVGDLALKLILPTTSWINQRLIEHFTEVNAKIPSIPAPLPGENITDFVMTLYDVYNAYHHLIIYAPLSTVMTRKENNRQLHNGIVELIRTLSNISQRLMQLGGDLLLNAAIDAIQAVGKIETGCRVDAGFKEYLQFERIEGLLNGGLLWTISSFPEYFLNTEIARDKTAIRAAVDFLLSFFKMFISENEFFSLPENSSLTIYKFNNKKNIYCKDEFDCDTEIKDAQKLDHSNLDKNFAAPIQCMNTNAFRICHFLIQYSPEEIEVDKITSIFEICLRLCLYRTIPVKNKPVLTKRRDCIPVFPFLRWKSVVGTDRFGNRKPGWSNTFNPLYNILLAALSFMNRNRKYKDFSNIIPLYCEVVFQIFNPVATVTDPKYMAIPLPSGMYNNKEFQELSIQIANIIKRPMSGNGLEEMQIKCFFRAIHIFWKDFESSKLDQLQQLLRDKRGIVQTTKSHGGFGILKFEGHIQASGPITPERCQSQSYGDPIFEALHMQVPLLLFSPEGLNRHLFHLHKFAFYAHPVKNILTRTPSYCYYLCRSRNQKISQQNRTSTLDIAIPRNQNNRLELMSSSKEDHSALEGTLSLNYLDLRFKRNGLLSSKRRELRQSVDSHSKIRTHDNTAASSLSSLSASSTNVSSRISSEDSMDGRFANPEIEIAASIPSEEMRLMTEEMSEHQIVSHLPQSVADSFEELAAFARPN